MIVAGVMSGTSADGINVALVRITDSQSAGRQAHIAGKQRSISRRATNAGLRIKLLGHAEYRYPKNVRGAILEMMNSPAAAVADIARLNFLLGELYAGAVLNTQRKFRRKAELAGCHGQTIYHQGEASTFLGRKIAATWQTGEGAMIAARLGIPVVSDFRPADMAAGGKGAPLVPFLDYFLYRDKHAGRIAQNIGGIANLTAIPAGSGPEQVIAFDTGPGNMVIDALMQRFFDKPFDFGGKVAASGKVLQPALAEILKQPFFSRRPPKTAGREEFGREFVQEFVRRCGRANKQDMIATATALTATSISQAIKRFVLPKGSFRELIVSGGGTKNRTLFGFLAKEANKLGLKLHLSDEYGIPSEAKEAVAFAVLAYETWHRLPSNVPSCTGAKRPAVLGKISYA